MSELEQKRDQLMAERQRLDIAMKQLQAQLDGIGDERQQIKAETIERVYLAALEGRSADLVDLAYRVSVLDLTADAIPTVITRLQNEKQSLSYQLSNVQQTLAEDEKAAFEQRLKTAAQQVKAKHGTSNRATFFSRVRDAMNDPHISENAIKRAMGWR